MLYVNCLAGCLWTIIGAVMTLEKHVKSYTQRQMWSALSWQRKLDVMGTGEVARLSGGMEGSCEANQV